jgi:predicted  nucleic acid-binding Zn-ribbon protein
MDIPKLQRGLTIDRSEILERFKYYKEYQNELREAVKCYENTNDAPLAIRKQIYENRIILNHYQEKISKINAKLHSLFKQKKIICD